MESVGAFIIGLIGVLATVGSATALFIKSRGENKTADSNAKTALDIRIDERINSQLEKAWVKMDEQDTELEEQKTKLDEQSEQIRILHRHAAITESRDARRTGAMTRILKDLANQWPNQEEGPKLNPADIAIIEETVPSEWIYGRKEKSVEQHLQEDK